MSSRERNQAVVYLRQSDSRQEISLEMQLAWAVKQASKHEVVLPASVAQLTEMRSKQLEHEGAIYVDDAVSGDDLGRRGFNALLRDLPHRKEISHLFAYKRDRLGRPEDPLSMMVIEQSITNAGITVVFNDGIALPTRRGETDLSHVVQMLFAYHKSGQELRDLADRVLDAHRHLAEQGFRTGGKAPYGFGRFLVDTDGNVKEELAEGRYVRQPGHHVAIRVNDPEKISIWVYILDLKAAGWGCKRIAKHLNDLGVPSPDAGRLRRDHGSLHAVSGRWSPNSVSNLCRNRAILGLQEYGRRSEGKNRRLGQSGPRLLDDRDRTIAGKPRVIINDRSSRISAPISSSGPEYDAEKWHAIQEQMDERSRSQRSIRRAKDPAKYPLSGRVIDMTDGCGAVMYGVTSGQRTVYRCGRYMRSAGSECGQNTADGEALLGFILETLAHSTTAFGGRERLRDLLLQRAQAEVDLIVHEQQTIGSSVENKVAELERQLKTAERRMATEEDDIRYTAIASQCDEIRAELVAARQTLDTAQQYQRCKGAVDEEVEAALSLVDNISRLAEDPAARAEIPQLLDALGVSIGLSFGPAIKGKKRFVQKLIGGVVSFGGAPLPVRLHGRTNREPLPSVEVVTKPAASDRGSSGKALSAKGDGELLLPGAHQTRHPEGISLTKVNRGDRI